jgi:hypothetical protein
MDQRLLNSEHLSSSSNPVGSITADMSLHSTGLVPLDAAFKVCYVRAVVELGGRPRNKRTFQHSNSSSRLPVASNVCCVVATTTVSYSRRTRVANTCNGPSCTAGRAGQRDQLASVDFHFVTKYSIYWRNDPVPENNTRISD